MACTNYIIYSFAQAGSFAAGVCVILAGVRLILAEIVPAFKGISEKIGTQLNSCVGLPIVFPYAPNAVLIRLPNKLCWRNCQPSNYRLLREQQLLFQVRTALPSVGQRPVFTAMQQVVCREEQSLVPLFARRNHQLHADSVNASYGRPWHQGSSLLRY